MKKIVKYTILSSFFLYLMVPLGSCEEPVIPQDLNLSLDEVISTAYTNNKDIQIQEKEVTAARANIVDARSNFLPKLNANVGYTHNGAVTPLNIPGKKDSRIFTGYQNENSAGLSINQIIYNGGANLATYKQSQLNLLVQEETLRAKRLDLEFEAKRLYYGLLLAYETERIAQELVDNATNHYEDVKKKFDQGTVSKFDVLQSKVQVSLLMPELIKSKNSIDLILSDLKKLMSFNIKDNVNIKDRNLEYTSLDIKEDDFLKEAYLNKPEMTLKSLDINISKWSIQMAKAGWRPQINADLGYIYNSNNWNNMFNSRHNNWNAGVSMTMPVFDGFSSKAKVDEAKARYAQANLSKENLVDQIAVDVRQSCLDLKESQAVIDSQKDNLEEAREALRLANVRYDNGVGTNLDVLDSQVSLGQVEQYLCNGIYDYLMAQSSLDRTMGKSYLKEVKDEKKN